MSDQRKSIWDDIEFTPLEEPESIDSVDYELLMGEKELPYTSYSEFKTEALEYLAARGSEVIRIDDIEGQKFYEANLHTGADTSEVMEAFWELQRELLSQKEEMRRLLEAQEGESFTPVGVRPSKIDMRFDNE